MIYGGNLFVELIYFRESNIGFSKLEILSLDENRFATSEVFAALATLPKFV